MAKFITEFLSLLYLLFNCGVNCEIPKHTTPTKLTFDRYYNNTDLTDFLKNFTDENRNFTRLYSIGRSIKKNELWVVELHNMQQRNSSIPLGIPNVKIIGNVLGTEPVGRQVILYLMEYLVKKYMEGDKSIQWLLNNTRIHLLPSLNPDGFEIAQPNVCNPDPRGRGNARKENINENFPGYFHRSTKPIQPETRAVMTWMKNISFVLSAHLRSGALVVNYPFDDNPDYISTLDLPSPTPDDDMFKELATLYANNHPTMHLGEPCKVPERKQRGFKDGIVNGASWKQIKGGMQDYNYALCGCMELTLEINCCIYPGPENLLEIWEANRKPLLNFISQVHRGIRGVIKNEDGQPITNATLRINGRDMSFKTSINGEFWRILLPGYYILNIKADGYLERNISLFVPNRTNEYNIPLYTERNITILLNDSTDVDMEEFESMKVNSTTASITLSQTTTVDKSGAISAGVASSQLCSSTASEDFFDDNNEKKEEDNDVTEDNNRNSNMTTLSSGAVPKKKNTQIICNEDDETKI